MKTPYNLSTDYEALYNLIQDGTIVAGFITSERYTNDIVKIRKFEDGDITFGARGIQYADLPKYWKEYPNAFGEGTEIEAFKRVCESVKLQWIMP